MGHSTTAKRTTLKSCPVCASKGCTGWDEGLLISCTTHRSETRGTVLNGYEFIKSDGVGLGLWKPHVEGKRVRNQNISSLEAAYILKGSQAYKEKKALSPEAQLSKVSAEIEQVETQALKVSLGKRDAQFREWAFQKPIIQWQHDDLLSRGLTVDQINEGRLSANYWDVKFGDNPTHADLPGKWDAPNKYGQSRAGFCGGSGLAIAAQQLNAKGELEVLGAQIAPGKAAIAQAAMRGDALPKYFWVSNSDSPQRAAKIDRLGGNPITVHPTGEAGATHVVVTEGILKPLVAFSRGQETHGIDLGAGVIGCAGTHWGSDGTFPQIKTQLSRLGANEVRLALDAGAVTNKDVMFGASKFARECLHSGIGFSVIWYDQFEKKRGDIDELSTITFHQLLSLGDIQVLTRAWAENNAVELPEDINSAPTVRFTPTEGYEKDYGYMPVHADCRTLIQGILSHKLSAIRAGKGTGKTQIAKLITELCHAENRAVLYLVHRVKLGEALASLSGLPLKYEMHVVGDHLGFVITADSAYPNSGMRFKSTSLSSDAVVIVDEADQVFWHVCYGGTDIKSHRTEVVEELGAAMSRASNVLLMSADLEDRDVDLIRKSVGLAPGEVLKIHNTHQRDLGKLSLYTDSYAVIHLMTERLAAGGRFMAKLSGQKDISITGTQTLHLLLSETFPEKNGIVFDSITLKTLKTNIDNGNGGTREVPILEYLSHHDEATRRQRQAEYFAQYDWVLFTNVCSTGVSFEAGEFTDFFQLEQGKGSVSDALQATARYRPTNVDRHVFVNSRCLDRFGSGAIEPNKLAAGVEKAFAAQMMALANAGAEWAEFEPVEAKSPLGWLWRNYAIGRAAEFNEQSYVYREAFTAAAIAEGYKVESGFRGEWGGLGTKLQKAFKAKVKDVRDRNLAARSEAEADEDVDDIEYSTLKRKRNTTPKEDRQIVKLKAMERYGLKAEEVTPEVINADKEGVYGRLLMRLYVELGLDATAQKDKAVVEHSLANGRTWSRDLLRLTHSHKVELLEKIGLPELLAHLRGSNADGKPNQIHKYSPEVVSLIERAVKLRSEIKESLGCTVGVVETTFNKDGSQESVVEVERPLAIIKTLLGKLELGLRSVGQARTDQGRAHLFELHDKLIPTVKKGEPEQPAIIDYAKFVEARMEADKKTIESAPNLPAPILKATSTEELGGTLDPNRSIYMCEQSNVPVDPSSNSSVESQPDAAQKTGGGAPGQTQTLETSLQGDNLTLQAAEPASRTQFVPTKEGAMTFRCKEGRAAAWAASSFDF